jgi:hypothetical protein
VSSSDLSSTVSSVRHETTCGDSESLPQSDDVGVVALFQATQRPVTAGPMLDRIDEFGIRLICQCKRKLKPQIEENSCASLMYKLMLTLTDRIGYCA